MRYVRATRCRQTGEVLAVIEQGVPFETGGIVEIEGRDCEMIDLGACEEFEAVGNICRGSYIFDRIEAHPLADTHEDAPKVRIKPDAIDAPALHFCPTSTVAILAHIDKRGPAGLPDVVKPALREAFKTREDVSLAQLRALGFTFDELKKHPRAHANRQRIEAEKMALAESNAKAAKQARIERRLAASKTTKAE